jgi:glycosyltransferase involved in cell wall biosynthesis
MTNKKILYTTHIKATFINKDTEFLKERYRLIVFDFHAKQNFLIPFLLVKQFVFLCINIYQSNVLVTQFAGYHSLLPSLFGKIFGKKNIIIVCGTDAYSFPSISYGNFRKPFLALFSSWSYKLCTDITPVDESLIETDSNYYNVDFPKQGIRYFVKNVKARFTTIYYGYENSFCKNSSILKKPNTFITIGKGTENTPVFYRKGIDLILAVAPKFPDCTFTIVGMGDVSKMPSAPSNVVYISFIEHKNLMNLLSEQAYYLQLSIAEGFPNALCEGMLCECVPIGSAVAAIPNIIGNTGFILEKKDENLLINVLQKALQADIHLLGKNARERIISNFGIEKRKEKFYNLIN